MRDQFELNQIWFESNFLQGVGDTTLTSQPADLSDILNDSSLMGRLYNQSFYFCNNKSEFWIPAKTVESNSSHTICTNLVLRSSNVPDIILYTRSKNGDPIRAHEAKIEVQSLGGDLKFWFIVAKIEIVLYS